MRVLAKRPWRRAATLSVLVPLVLLAVPRPASGQVGSVLDEVKISQTQGGFGGVLEGLAKLGWSSAALGDLDGDGHPELAVGAPQSMVDGMITGAVWILTLDPDGTVRAEHQIAAGHGGFVGPLEPFDSFGTAVCALGDVDGDGVGDLAVGMDGADATGSSSGAVWILFLDAAGQVVREQRIDGLVGGLVGPLEEYDSFGCSAASLGDLDGDGRAELAVGAIGDDDGGSGHGAVWVLFLEADGTVRREAKISDTAGSLGGILDDGDGFGCSVTALRDRDGNGVPEIVAGARDDDDGSTGFYGSTGAVWIVFVDQDLQVLGTQKISALEGGLDVHLNVGDQFGWSVGAVGDLDGDGLEDLGVGVLWDDDGGFDRGALWILSLRTDGTVLGKRKISQITGGFGGVLDVAGCFGSSVARVGDLDDDGVDELGVGAAYADDGGYELGALWVLTVEGVSYPAAAIVRNGSGANPLVLTALGRPTLGADWSALVDASDYPAATTTLLAMLADGSPVVPTGPGELLVDLGSTLLALDAAAVVSGSATHTLSVPADPALAGFTATAQAALLGGAPLLTNALELHLGN